MGVCEVVAELANTVAEARRPLNHRHTLMVHVLRSAAVYRDAGRLDAWESAYQDAGGDDESSTIDQLLDSIFSFGRYNLYAGFNGPGTRKRYQELAREFSEAGIPIPESPNVSDW